MNRWGTAALTCLLFGVVVFGALVGFGRGCGAHLEGLPGIRSGADPAYEAIPDGGLPLGGPTTQGGDR